MSCHEQQMQKEQFPVTYLQKDYDLGTFLRNHPGGVNYVKPYRNKDVRKRMLDTNHAKSAYYLLREYQRNGRDEITNEDTEDLEKLVDWNKPMLGQVASLGEKYNEWVISPVDRKLRLFANPILENLTLTPWFLVPIIWIPVICVMIYYGCLKYIHMTEDISIITPTFCIFIGIITWSLIEYSLHRWVFHLEPSGSSKALIIVHFTLHGLHHKAPFDTRRLVFPPFPAAIVILAGYKLCSFVAPESMHLLVVAGGIMGYVIYDMIHYYLHAGSPKEGSYMYYMKRYHNQHHFAEHNSGFGISSHGWDFIFGTIITLKRLTRGIEW